MPVPPPCVGFRPTVAVVTGASAGFGAAIARRLAGLGCRLVLTARRADRLVALAAELPVPVHVAAFDVRDRAAVADAFAALPASFAAVDLLVNNAGLALGLEPAHEASLDDWERMIDTNDKGLVYCTRALLPGMVERRRGHVVNIGSVAGVYPYPGGNVYCASKAFVAQFSLALRADLHGSGVRVTCIEPGLAGGGGSEFSLVRFHGDDARAARVYDGTTPLAPEDVAEAVVWCATLPEHVNVNRLELMPTGQSFAGFPVCREGA